MSLNVDNHVIHLDRVTRLVVVSGNGVELDAYNKYEGGVDLLVQDDGKTLKIFPKKERTLE